MGVDREYGLVDVGQFDAGARFRDDKLRRRAWHEELPAAEASMQAEKIEVFRELIAETRANRVVLEEIRDMLRLTAAPDTD